MSELGSNQGQDENKNTTVFDSANLAEKQKAEHFTNVEGNEARAKAAERQAKAVEKKAEAAHVGDIKKAAKKEAGDSKGGFLNFLFGGWHKIVTIALILVIIGGGIFLAFRGSYESDGAVAARDAAAIGRAQSIYSKAEETRLEGSYAEAKTKFESAIKSANREEKIFLTIRYAEYIARFEYDSEYAYALMDDVKGELRTEIENDYYLMGMNNIETYTGVNYE